jgi:hypothetical protein
MNPGITRVFGQGATLFILWSVITFLFLLAFGKALNYGSIAILFSVPTNVAAHLMLRMKFHAYSWKGFIAYLAGLHLILLIIGAFVEENWAEWAVEVSWRVSFLYGIVFVFYLLIDWVVGILHKNFGA